MSQPIALHTDGTDCYTCGRSLGHQAPKASEKSDLRKSMEARAGGAASKQKVSEAEQARRDEARSERLASYTTELGEHNVAGDRDGTVPEDATDDVQRHSGVEHCGCSAMAQRVQADSLGPRILRRQDERPEQVMRVVRGTKLGRQHELAVLPLVRGFHVFLELRDSLLTE